MTEVCIALDAMGGDHGPSIVVPAAIKSVKENPNLKVILVGIDKVINEYLDGTDKELLDRISVHHASQVVEMDEKPSFALRGKKDSSMRVALNLVKQGNANACVSSGNTGALMATARFVLKMLPGIDRPAIVYTIPTQTGHVYMLDLGANVDCQAEHLYQFAVMGSISCAAVDNIERPKVALLNIGSEAIKGSEQVKSAALLLSEAKNINYTGYIEGDEIFSGKADVVVCDGFVGNVALKVCEGILDLVIGGMRKSFMSSLYGKFVGLLAKPLIKRVTKDFDPEKHNGASLLGLNGIVIKSHGKAKVNGFASAIKVAMLESIKNVPLTIKKEVTEQLQEKSVEITEEE